MAKTNRKDSRAVVPPFHTPDHPPYAEMVRAAITALNEKGGSSEEAISTYIESAYLDLPWGHVGLLSYHLSKLTELGEITRSHDSLYSLPILQQTTPGPGRKERPPNSRPRPRSRPQPPLLDCKPLCAPVRLSPMMHSVPAVPENCSSQLVEYRANLSEPRPEAETSESGDLVKCQEPTALIDGNGSNEPLPKSRGRHTPKPRHRRDPDMSKAGDLITFPESATFIDVGESSDALPKHRGRPPKHRRSTRSELEAIPLAIEPPRPAMLLRRSSRLHSAPAVPEICRSQLLKYHAGPEPEMSEARDLLMCPEPTTLIEDDASDEPLPKRRRGRPPKRSSCESKSMFLACKSPPPAKLLCAPVRRSPRLHPEPIVPENCRLQLVKYCQSPSKPRPEPEMSDAGHSETCPRPTTLADGGISNDLTPQRRRGRPPKRRRPEAETSESGN